MTDWSKQRPVFPRTYSRKPGFYRPRNAASFTPVPIIGIRKDPRRRFGHLQTPQNTPTSSDSEDSSQYDDSTQQVISHSEQQSQTDTTNDSCSSTDNNEVTILNPNAPYHYGEKRQYSIIIEESDDMGNADNVGRIARHRPPVKPPAKCIPKSNRFGVRLLQTKLMKDSLERHTESEDSEDVSSSDLDSISFSPNSGFPEESTNDDLSNIDKSAAEYEASTKSEQQPAAISDEDRLPDIEVMRDAPSLKTHRRRPARRGDLASSLKITAMKLHAPGGNTRAKPPYRWKAGNRDRKNSTFREDRLSAKPIQELSFSQDISDIPGGQTTTSDALTDDDSVSTIKPTPQQHSSDEATLKEISLNFEEDPVPVGTRGARSPASGYIRTPKKHNIHRDPLRRTPLQMEPDGKQVSFSKTNQESLYVPGSKIADTSDQLPQLGSPSMSILKKAVATWNLQSQKDKKESLHGATTSTPLWRRRSRSKEPNMMDLSFEVSAVQLPSYDDLRLMPVPIRKPVQQNTASKHATSTGTVPPSGDEDLSVKSQQETSPDKVAGNTSEKGVISSRPQQHEGSRGLIITSLSLNKKPASSSNTNTSEVRCESPEAGVNATPSKQLKRESPGSDIPARPNKRRAMPVSSNSGSDTQTRLSQHQKQKKRLDYRNGGRGQDTCIIRRLPDRLFKKTEHPIKLPSLSKVDASCFKNVPIDSLTVIPNSVFTGVIPSTGIKSK